MPATPVPHGQLPGPLMVDVATDSLTTEDLELIAHPLVGGVILFTRNYRSKDQLRALIKDLRAARNGPLLIAADHEGGRVQRFREEFTLIPPMRRFSERYDQDKKAGLAAVRDAAFLMAWELRECGLDFTFSPVVDIDHGQASVIGDRALHNNAKAVAEMGHAVIEGLNQAGCGSVIKHFPGHGSVSADTHTSLAVDKRPYDEIALTDLPPFCDLCSVATAVMPAHVIYESVDSLPASLSSVWQQQILRDKLNFKGAIISDDLTMAGVANIAPQARSAAMAIAAGTDLALICNDRQAALAAVDNADIPVGDTDTVNRRLSLMATEVQPPDPDTLTQIIRQLQTFA